MLGTRKLDVGAVSYSYCPTTTLAIELDSSFVSLSHFEFLSLLVRTQRLQPASEAYCNGHGDSINSIASSVFKKASIVCKVQPAARKASDLSCLLIFLSDVSLCHTSTNRQEIRQLPSLQAARSPIEAKLFLVSMAIFAKLEPL